MFVGSCSTPEALKGAGKDGGLDLGGPDEEADDDAGGTIKEDPGNHEDPDAGGATTGTGNKARVVSVAPTYALAEESYKYQPKSNLAEQTQWKVEQGPPGLMVEDDGATISWTPGAEQKGKHEIVLSAKVGGHELSQTGEITVAVADERAAVEIDESVGGSVTVTAPKSLVAGASVYAGPASLKQPTRLSISEVDQAPAMGIAKGASHAVKFGPSGTVFSEPALITLPLSDETPVTNKSRVGAFVYDAKGRWVRVPVVDVDTDKGVVFAKAKHFSVYSAAEMKLGLDVTAKLAPSTGGCADALFVDAWLSEPAAQVDASAISNLPAELAALAEGKTLSDFLALSGVRGSVRVVRVVELAQGDGGERVVLERRLLVTTLYLAGDGSAKLTHVDALGHVLGSFTFGAVRDNLSTIWAQLSGRAVRAVFLNAPEGSVSIGARLHALYFDGEASLDPISADDLGFALVDADFVAVSSPATDGKDTDLDCDGLIKSYDGTDDRLMPGIVLKPQGVSSGVVKSPVRLMAALVHAGATDQLTWRVLSGSARLSAVEGAPEARDFSAEQPGRFQVEVSAEVEGEALASVFTIDVSPETTLPVCTPSPAVATLKQGESVGLSAVLAENSLGASALSIEWGIVVDKAFVSSAELEPRGYEARLTPSNASRYTVACRAVQGTRNGTFGTTGIDVVPAQQNLPPTDLTISPAYETLMVGASLTFGASGRDPEGAALRFGWTSNGGALGTPDNQKSKSKVSFSAAKPGLYEVRVAIRDQAELAQELRAFVLVVAQMGDTDGVDADRDGWPAKLDCDDNNAKVHPGAIDRCGDAIDDDCNGVAKQSDCDDDGFTTEAGDCNDANREIRPGAPERCDGLDNNCDTVKDEGFGIGGTCSAGRGQCQVSAKLVCSADGFGAVCPAVPNLPKLETCNGQDDDCDGAVDEDYKPKSETCGLGVCQSTGMTSCVAGVEVKSCVPKQGAASDLTCDGLDNDCDGSADEDVFKLAEVCNGRDDDCDGMIDESLSCGNAPAATCTPRGAEVCNGEDDDCNGRFDENNVCGLSGDASSLLGVFFLCQNAACTALAEDGFMFLAGGSGIKARSFDEQSYDPGHGPYCVDGPFTYQVNGDQITWNWLEDKVQHTASGTFVLRGSSLTLNFTSAPSDMLGVHELKRVPEQAGGACQHGPVCQSTEICGNGFDDNCNQLVDAADPACAATCTGTKSVEVCDGLDNDCNGMVDDINQPCQRNDAFGICKAGHAVCVQGAAVCQAGSPDPAGEACGDGVDNDCDNAIDEAGCVTLTPAETCFNAINVSAGGVFTSPRGERNDVSAACRPSNYVDRMFYISTSSGLNSNYTIFVDGPPALDVGGALYKMPIGYTVGSACPSITPSQGMCLGKMTAMTQYLDTNSIYMLVVETSADASAQGANFMLSVARSDDGICSPGDEDQDGVSICAGDCNDGNQAIHPRFSDTVQAAPELCNNLDDDCDGLIDEQDGNCNTGLLGACAVGVSECNQTPTCRPVQNGRSDYCGDGVDNDCNGAVDDNCVTAPGEACDNAVDLGNGGAVSGTLVGAADDAVSRCGGAGPERFYRFTVPQNGYVTLTQVGYPNSLRFALYSDCSLTPVQCSFKGGQLAAGTYRLAVEASAANNLEAYAFTLGITDGKNCITPDSDGDGVVACFGDCDESRASVNSTLGVEGASCDGLDNDCNGMVDDVHTLCPVAGLQGVCADGELRCGPQGASSCVQARFPDAQGRDICADGLDNDCDGALDAQDPQSCVSLPLGETCALAHQVDISAGGMFPGTLAGYADDVQLGCDYSSGGIERFYSLTLNSARVVHIEARSPYQPGDVGMVGVMRVANCATLGMAGTAGTCSGGSFAGELPAGTHVFAVYGPSGRSYDLLVSTQAVGDVTGSTCVPADLDHDGFTLCTGDCREGDARLAPNVAEVCDNLDNNCNNMVDDNIQSTGCVVNGGVGDCAQGHIACTQGAQVCESNLTPGKNPEICNDSRDNDCDGPADDRGTPGVDCQLLTGETCSDALPIGNSGVFDGTLNGAQSNGTGCYGGAQGLAEERYYRFDIPQPGTYFVQVKPVGAGPFPEFSFGIEAGMCTGNAPNACAGPRQYGVVRFDLPVGGPQYLVVESDDPVSYRISVASMINAGTSCSLPDGDGDGMTLCDLDCDDSNQTVHPGATEVCNGRDDNCDGVVDERC